MKFTEDHRPASEREWLTSYRVTATRQHFPPATAGHATFNSSARRAIPRPTIPRRKHPDLTGFLIGCVGLVGFLFLATVAFAHVTERTLLTVAQGEARRGM
ncbi:hypothetical protein C5F48_20285 [Cereibacter changlensis JA139]|uniref:Uncharacterized protein n=2 Tax=Cereibacter changlensis TaxID=402884 RepID=A0A2T4JPT7_9RHOB|nr:hypothetical protein [Cereibacter changlensis]PTE19930.1 hypothetical protein C5F48_20285 [Cereibacter changlensis JA139]PZX50772.1 hypothetical protein LX76_03311 [Cereibacter changlensis]PZX54224.1 hypothetical protein LX76_01867 [Cereibacter changlensis]